MRFKGRLVVISIAISYLVMIIAVSVSSGFRNEIRNGLSEISGDIQITPPNLNVLDQSRPIEGDAAYIPYVRQVEGVAAIDPVASDREGGRISSLSAEYRGRRFSETSGLHGRHNKAGG